MGLDTHARRSLTTLSLVGGATVLAAYAWPPSSVECHGVHHDHDSGKLAMLERRLEALEREAAARYGVEKTTGEGDMVFSWDEALTAAFPAECHPFEKDMHGGFSEDPDTNIVYTGIPGAGLYSINPELTEWTLLGNDPRLKANIHGLTVFKHDGETLIAMAQNNDERVLICDLNGKVLQALATPKGGEFTFGEANVYYSQRRNVPRGNKVFACTDVAYLQDKLYVVTGYCQGDYVLSARKGTDGQWKWGPTAWGGKGEGGGQFKTAHGVFAHEGHIFVANREAFQVVQFTPEGQLVGVLPDIPHGARICNVSHASEQNVFVMNALAPLTSTANHVAPIYTHNGNNVTGSIDASSLGIPVLKHLHHVWPHYVTDDKGNKVLHILLHGWRDGKFAVLKHEVGK